MPTYVYETVPASKNARPKRFEIKQSIKDAPLKKHPETGEPVKRVITGGVGVITSAAPASGGKSHAHSSGCGCGAGHCGR